MTAPSFVAVLPAIDPAATRACVMSMDVALRMQLLVVDNATPSLGIDWYMEPLCRWQAWPSGNLGVPASWNAGIEMMEREQADWLVILSTSIRFGAHGGADLLDLLDRTNEQWVVGTQHGWKCIALSRALLTRVGRFDPVFSPGYSEDTDMLLRMARAGLPSPRENGGTLTQFMVDAGSMGDALAVKAGLVKVDFTANRAAYIAKWGGPQGEETFQHPYNDERLDWTFTGPYDPALVPCAE